MLEEAERAGILHPEWWSQEWRLSPGAVEVIVRHRMRDPRSRWLNGFGLFRRELFSIQGGAAAADDGRRRSRNREQAPWGMRGHGGAQGPKAPLPRPPGWQRLNEAMAAHRAFVGPPAPTIGDRMRRLDFLRSLPQVDINSPEFPSPQTPEDAFPSGAAAASAAPEAEEDQADEAEEEREDELDELEAAAAVDTEPSRSMSSEGEAESAEAGDGGAVEDDVVGPPTRRRRVGPSAAPNAEPDTDTDVDGAEPDAKPDAADS